MDGDPWPQPCKSKQPNKTIRRERCAASLPDDCHLLSMDTTLSAYDHPSIQGT